MSRRWLTSLFSCALMVLSVSALAADAPEKLTWNDLVNHPERWPDKCKMTRMIRFSVTDSLPAGTECRVVGISGKQAQLMADNSQFEAPADYTDLLDQANAAWAKLTPEQRSLTVAAVMKDKTLWPATVTVKELQDFGQFKIKAGETVPVVGVQQNQDLQVMVKGSVQWAPVPMPLTDFFARARDIAGMPAEKRPNRVAGILNSGLLVDNDGKPVQAKEADHYVIYWSGSQCTWCAQYNAKWVDYYKKTLADRKDVQVFSMANDRQMPVFYAYAKKNNYAWPVLPNTNLAFTEVIGPLGTIQMPGIIVFDKSGKIVASTLRQKGTPLQTADAVVAQLDQLIVKK